jgi:hypothetical protein
MALSQIWCAGIRQLCPNWCLALLNWFVRGARLAVISTRFAEDRDVKQSRNNKTTSRVNNNGREASLEMHVLLFHICSWYSVLFVRRNRSSSQQLSA